MVEEGQLLWEPSAQRVEASNLHRYQQWLEARLGRTFGSYEELWQWSVDELEEFWGSIWDYCDVIASTPADTVLADRAMPGARWFPGAHLNYAEHVLRHSGDGTALVWVGEEEGQRADLTWDELRGQVAAVASTLRGLGVEPGDRVVGYLPNVPSAVVAFLAAAAVGAVWSSCSPDFGASSVVARFEQIRPKVLFAGDGYRYGGKVLDRTAVVQELRDRLPSLEHVVSVGLLDPDWAPAGTLAWRDCLATEGELAFAQVPFDHPLWILYSSGTTGAPKGIVHGHGGITLDLLAALALHMDLGPDDTFFWFTTTGWVMWNIVVSTLMLGTTAVLYDGSPGYPHVGRLWEIAAETRSSVFGVGAAYLAASEQAGLEPARQFDLSALRALSYTGSPLAHQGYRWVLDQLGDEVWFSSVSGGTDVCGPFVGGSPTLPLRAGEIQCRCLGNHVQAFDPQGRPLVDEVGELVVTAPIPSMPLYLWGDEDGSRYRDTYFDTYPGVWRHGDWLRITPEGGVVIYGRSDATINRQGVRIGSAEIYAAVESMPEVLDSLVVDLTYRDRESRVHLFVVLADGLDLDDELEQRMRRRIREETSPRHVPDDISAVDAVPRTLNNKKLEVPVRRILLGVPVDEALNRDSVGNPESLEFFVALAAGRTDART